MESSRTKFSQVASIRESTDYPRLEVSLERGWEENLVHLTLNGGFRLDEDHTEEKKSIALEWEFSQQ